jgi:serine/threonine protein kinase
MKPLAPNTLLQNRYLIVHLIGKGGMGEVYLAVDQRLGSAVALKRTFFSDDEQLGSAFEREARTLARLRHAVLPKVSDHFTENDTQYLVMEHISGDDLSKRLETTNKPFPLNWVLFWADQLLDALAYLHSHEPPIVHRDIKPQNLKLTGDNHIILLDFGLAKNSTGGTHVTTGGSIVGYTPHYAPMEQIRGTGTSARSDLYSLAATLYQLLTAQVPPDALTRADYILNTLPDPVKPLNEVNPEVPKAISDVIIKGMSLSAEQRYQTAREMQKALRDAYAQMQNRMNEQTVAFNVPQQQTPQTSQPVSQVPPSQTRTEQFNQSVNSQPQQPTANIPVSAQPQMFEKTEVLEKAPAPPVDFDMTLRDEPFIPVDLPQSQQKTEVLPAADVSSQIPKQEDDFAPESTVPLISFDPSVLGNEPSVGATQAAANYDSTPAQPPVNTVPPNYGSPYDTGAFSPPGQTQSGNQYNSQPQTANQYNSQPQTGNQFNSQPQPLYAAAAPQKSGGKGLAIAGILGGLGVVTVAAAGIGLYAFGDRLGITGTQPTPLPTAQPTVTATATPAPSVERANTNSENNSQTVAVSNTNTGNLSNTNTNSERVTTEPIRTGTPIPRPTQVTVAQPVRTPPRQTNTPKPVVQKPATPKPGGRTDILQ